MPALILFLLFLINLLNFFDRTLPAVVTELLRREWNLNDLQLGIGSSAFTLVYALAGLPLGRLSDSRPRKSILSGSLLVWSALTAATGIATGYMSFLWIRLGVGVGEAGCAPAATSLIGDLYPTEKRARAIGIFMLGLPLGLMAAFFGGGALVKALHGWRTPFFIAAVPGVIIALLVLFIREPVRGAADGLRAASVKPVETPIRKILAIPTMRWIILSGVFVNFAAYAGNGFMVSLLQRYFRLPIDQAANRTGVIVGITGLIGLTLGGTIADQVGKKSLRGRLVYGAISLLLAAPATYLALEQGRDGAAAFTVLFGLGWLLYYSYYTTVYAALQDVIEPRLRATALALYFVGMYVLGGAAGPTAVGALSDRLAHAAMAAANAPAMTIDFKAIGLHDSMKLIPLMLFLTAISVYLASRTFEADAKRMKEGL
jgi:MFS family permease